MNLDKLKDMSNEDYHSLKDSFSASDMKVLANTSYKDWEYQKSHREETDALRFGSAFHHYVLEYDTFYENYAVEPEFEPTEIDKKTEEVKPKTKGWKNTKDYKGQRDEFHSANSDKTIISEYDFNRIKGMQRAIKESIANEYIYGMEGINEKVCFSELNGVKVRVKFDRFIPSKAIVVDLKSTSDASEYDFARSVVRFGYDIQDVHYTNVLSQELGEQIKMVFVAVSSEAPFSACVYTLGEDKRERGKYKLNNALNRLKRAFDGNYGHEAESKVVSL